MYRKLRSFLTVPLAMLAVVALAALLLSVGNPQVAQGQTAPGQPTSTVPPTATPRPPLPPRPVPTATVRAQPISDARARANGWILKEVIGNRLSSTLYGVAIAPRLYRSDDNGASWALIARTPAITDFLMSPADPDILYSTLPIECAGEGAPTSLYRSDDAGASWTMLYPGFDLAPLIADPQDEDVVIAAGCDGLYRTEDGGWSWSPLSTALDAPVWETRRAQAIEAVSYAKGDVATLDSLYALAVDEDDVGVLLFSDDGGVSWREISPMGAEFIIHAFAVDPWHAERIWLSEAAGVWSTEDQGDYWTLSANGLEDAIALGLSDIVYRDDDALYVGSAQGAYAKAAGRDAAGDLWLPAGNRTLQRQAINELVLTDTAPRQLWLNAANGVYLVRR